MSQEKLEGTWKLLSYAMLSDGKAIYPLGEDCQGILTLNAGYLHGQLMNPHRPRFADSDAGLQEGTPEEIQAAYRGYVAYWATYTVDEEQSKISCQVRGSLFPNWIGRRQDRFYSFEESRMTLRTTPLSIGGMDNVVGALTWERLG